MAENIATLQVAGATTSVRKKALQAPGNFEIRVVTYFI